MRPAKFDFRQELAEVYRKRAAIERRMFDIPTERMLLAALVANDAIENRPPYLEHTVCALDLIDDLAINPEDELELDDFANGQHREVFTVLRNAGATRLDLVDIHDAIRLRDITRESSAAEVVSLSWLLDLVALEPRATVTWIQCAMKRLRALAQHRRLA